MAIQHGGAGRQGFGKLSAGPDTEALRPIKPRDDEVKILQEAKDHRLPADVVQEELVIRPPSIDVDLMFETVVGWGRYAELLAYDADAERVMLTESGKDASEEKL